MGRLLSALLLALCHVPLQLLAEEAQGRHQLAWGWEGGYVNLSGLSPRTDGALGKFRFQDEGLVASRGFFEYTGRITDTWSAHAAMEAYDDNVGDIADVTEAYLEWRPVPRSATRYRLKVGAFYPRISLENTGLGWSSPYTLNSSTINTWVAEELRTFGAELSASRRPLRFGGAHAFSATVAVFTGNDPAGATLAWQGWAIHDRQLRLRDKWPLPPLPAFSPGNVFELQAPLHEPFRDVDGRLGYTVNLEWRYKRRLLVRAMHYDNRADPLALDDGQYGWATRFRHIGVQASLPGDIGLLAQWMSGSTAMGPIVNARNAVDLDFGAAYLLVTRSFDDHRVTARYDHFYVDDYDPTPMDNNAEDGHAWTASYQCAFNERVSLAAEWVRIDSYRPAYRYLGLPANAIEEQRQLMLRMRF
ncbi:MAG: hypothetical protein AAGC71_02290 [Pseudomonadota bacterium]